MTRAAQSLNLAQSAASAAIAALEAQHATRLFDRVGRGIVLTQAGQLFLPEARAILARVEAAELVLSDLSGLMRGTLGIHASHTIASYWLPRHLVAFRLAYPGITIRLAVGNTAQVAAAVQGGLAELGFVEGATEAPLLTRAEIARDQLIVVVGNGHPWAAGDPVTTAGLAAAQWVLREPGSGTRSAFEAALAARGVVIPGLDVVLELPSNESVRAAVEAGLGATALSASVAAASLEAGLLHVAPWRCRTGRSACCRMPSGRAARPRTGCWSSYGDRHRARCGRDARRFANIVRRRPRQRPIDIADRCQREAALENHAPRLQLAGIGRAGIPHRHLQDRRPASIAGCRLHQEKTNANIEEAPGRDRHQDRHSLPASRQRMCPDHDHQQQQSLPRPPETMAGLHILAGDHSRQLSPAFAC